jgi:hypothetical protein
MLQRKALSPTLVKPRTKSISAAAVIFALDALLFLAASFIQLTFVMQHHGAARFNIASSLVVCSGIVAVGLWRMSLWSRVAGCLLSGGSLCYLVVRFLRLLFNPLPEMRTYSGPEWIGFAIGVILCILWIGAPLYFLTRASSAAAFKQSQSR